MLIMMGVEVDPTTIQRWAYEYSPLSLNVGEWMKPKKLKGNRLFVQSSYKSGNSVHFLLTKRRQRLDAPSFLIKATCNNYRSLKLTKHPFHWNR